MTEDKPTAPNQRRDDGPDSDFPCDPPKTALPFDFTPEAKARIRKRNAERKAKGLPLTTLALPGAFGATPLFPELRAGKALNEAVEHSSMPEYETLKRPKKVTDDGE